MNQTESGAVLRICAVDEHRWDVLSGSTAEPVATFNDKHAALAYALSLARSRATGQVPFGRRQEILHSMFFRG